MLVEVTEAEFGSFRPTIEAVGTVQPEQDIILRPRVGGEITRRSDDFTPGGFVRKGETLLKIDPADYETVLAQRQSELRQARADLEIEMGRQRVARQDFELLGEVISAEDDDLVLREPQLETAKSVIESAEAAVRQAELNLERTDVRAPFDAYVLSREANLGSQVAEGDALGRLVGVEEYWVIATVPLSKLQWISIPEEGERGAEVRIRDRAAWPKGQFRTGRVDQLVGALEEQTRLARVLVAVPDPLSMESPDKPSLMIGSFVETHIQAKEIAEVFRIDRDFVRENDTVWVKENGELQIREVEVVFRDADYAYVSSGLKRGDQVVTTNLSTVSEGARLRVADPSAEAAD